MKIMINLKKYYKKYWNQEPTSASALLLYKTTCALISVGYTTKHFRVLKRTKAALRERALMNSATRRSVFVFANGPSLRDINLGKIRALQEQGTHDVIALNSFLSKSGRQIRPDYAIFADRGHFENKEKDSELENQYLSDIQYCRENNVTTLVPAEFCRSTNLDTKLAFCTIGNIYGNNTGTICKPVGFYRLTALYALVLAKELGYQNIYIAGFDNSYFKDFEVTKNGECLLRHIHYYDDNITNTTVRPLAQSTTSVFYDFYKHFYFIEKVTRGDTRIFNVAKTTYLSSIPIDLSLDIYNPPSCVNA